MIGTLEGWRAYAQARGDQRPAQAANDVALAALTRASDYIRFRYVARLIPGYDEGSLPIIVEATYVAASLELATPGFFAKTYTPAEQKVLTEVKGIKWTVTGDASKPGSASPVSSTIEDMFAPYVRPLGASGFMLRSIGG